MNKIEDIIFRVSKSKAVLTTLLAIVSLAILIWIAYAILFMSSLAFILGLFLISAGIFPALLAVSYLFYGIKSLIGSGKGITISNDGLKVDIGTNNGYFVNWSEITDLKVDTNIYNPIHLLISVENPDKLINKSCGLQKIQLKTNALLHKTPVSLTALMLSSSFKTLLTSICSKYYTYLVSQDKQKMKSDIENLLTEYEKINKYVKKVHFWILMMFLAFVSIYLIAFIAVLIFI